VNMQLDYHYCLHCQLSGANVSTLCPVVGMWAFRWEAADVQGPRSGQYSGLLIATVTYNWHACVTQYAGVQCIACHFSICTICKLP